MQPSSLVITDSKANWVLDTSFYRDFYVVNRTDLPFRTKFSEDEFWIPENVLAEYTPLARDTTFVSQGIVTDSTKAIPTNLDGARYQDLSWVDVSSLGLAKTLPNCGIYTSDKAQLLAAKRLNIPVRGTFWVLKRVIEMGLMIEGEVREMYRAMRAAGRRLPELQYLLDYLYFGWPTPANI